jgi:signal transduction histidine kinase/DNA-binding response OmpR family regulator
MTQLIENSTPWWRKISIRNKLKFSIIGFSLLALIIFTSTIILTADAYFHKKTREDLKILANVFSENLRAAVAFSDPSTANLILTSLLENPHITKAVIFKNKKIFAIYPNNSTYNINTEQDNINTIWLYNDSYYISVPIILNKQIIGNLLLVSDLKEWLNIRYNLFIIFIVMLIALIALTTMIALWLESQITKPLFTISDWAMHATKTKNFSIRVNKTNQDEIGSLIDSLNAMLSALVKQESIIALNKQLTYQISERENAEKALIIMRDQADAANKSKSIFLANMSHEIRTPLNGVVGMTNLLLTTKMSAQQASYAETIKQSGQTLLTIINEILDFSKIESGHLHLENVNFNLYILLDEIIETLAPLAYAKDLAIGTLIQPNVPVWINGDPARLRQILTNLLGNSIKFTDKGEIELNVSLEKSTNGHGSLEVTLRFEVIDTGIGINPEVRSNLFQIFTQGDSSTSRKYGGTGLGLVISKRLAELMNGTMNVESGNNGGSKFWFTIRVSVAPVKEAIAENKFLHSLKNVRVLAVDDNSINRRVVVLQTESWGMRCDVVDNGFDAIAKLRAAAAQNDPYSICLLDYSMPIMNGCELAEEIQKIPEIANIPILMMTSMGQPFPEKKLRRMGISTCITKPVRQSTLFDNIISMLHNSPYSTSVIKENEAKSDTVTTSKTKSDSKAPAIEEKSDIVVRSMAATQSAKILLAEDNTVNQFVALSTLEVFGYTADTALNGKEVLEALKKSSYDLILMDCHMPEMDGYVATQEIRKQERKNHTKHIAIIAMTANALVGDAEKCKAAGMDDYISKPFDMAEFGRKLEYWLGENKSLSGEDDKKQ